MSISVDRLAERAGVAASYHGLDGHLNPATQETKRALLRALGFDFETDKQAGDLLKQMEAHDAERALPCEAVLAANQAQAIDVRRSVEWSLILEDETTPRFEGRSQKGVLDLPALPPGVHRLVASASEEEVVLIAAPNAAPSLTQLCGRDRVWGLTAALYGLRSETNGGIGNFADLGEFARAAARQGASFVGINPIHAIGMGESETISPYSPTSRLFLNASHIATNAAPCGTTDLVSHWQAEGGLIDYARSRQDKLAELEVAHRRFLESAPPAVRDAFQAFCDRGDRSLARFATFEAIAEQYGGNFQHWPTLLTDPQSDNVARFGQAHSGRVKFHQWLQWVACEQLDMAQAQAKSAGMPLGLYLDIAVGVRPGSADVWSMGSAMASGVALGSPPDDFSPQGQNWHLVPFSPIGLREQAYRPFVETIRSTLRYCGLARIDHALGLSRGYWIPNTGEPGGYVRYPLRSLLAIVAIEACRANALIIGEDLGLVPDEFREAMTKRGLYGCDIMQFNRRPSGALIDVRQYRARSLASFGNHDLPTVKGYVRGHDLEWRAKLGLGEAPDTNQVTARRDQVEQLHALVFGDGGSAAANRAEADLVHEVLAQSNSELVAVQLDDLLEHLEQQNLPGTIDQHPNWRRRYDVATHDLAEHTGLSKVGKIMQKAGR